MDVFQLFAGSGQEGSTRTWAWEVAEVLMADSRWGSLKEVAKQNMSMATPPTPEN